MHNLEVLAIVPGSFCNNANAFINFNVPCTSGVREGLWKNSVRTTVRDPDRFGTSFPLPFVFRNVKAGLRYDIEAMVIQQSLPYGVC